MKWTLEGCSFNMLVRVFIWSSSGYRKYNRKLPYLHCYLRHIISTDLSHLPYNLTSWFPNNNSDSNINNCTLSREFTSRNPFIILIRVTSIDDNSIALASVYNTTTHTHTHHHTLSITHSRYLITIHTSPYATLHNNTTQHTPKIIL